MDDKHLLWKKKFAVHIRGFVRFRFKYSTRKNILHSKIFHISCILPSPLRCLKDNGKTHWSLRYLKKIYLLYMKVKVCLPTPQIIDSDNIALKMQISKCKCNLIYIFYLYMLIMSIIYLYILIYMNVCIYACLIVVWVCIFVWVHVRMCMYIQYRIS